MNQKKNAMSRLPASEKQIALINDLADQVGGIGVDQRFSMWEASEIIDAYLARRRSRLFGLAATLRR